MIETPNLKLEKYELDDAANLTDGYNNSMDKIDAAVQNVSDKFPITSSDIEDGTIQAVDIANGAITTNKISTAAVTGEKIAEGTISADKIEEGVIPELDYSQIPDDTITNPMMQANSVETDNIVAGSVSFDKIAPQAYDADPTEGDYDKLVTSGGVYDAIKNIVIPEPITPDKTLAVYIGNSFALGTGATDGNGGIFNRTKNMFDNAYLFWGDGLGFSNYSNHSTSFNDKVNEAANSSSFNNSDVTDVIFVSAMGDTRAVCENINFPTFNNTINNVRAKFPNARIYVYFAEITGTKTVQASYSNKYAVAQCRVHMIFNQNAASYGYTYLGWGGWDINFNTEYTSADNYHPNNAGYIYLADYFFNSIKTGPSYQMKYFLISGNDKQAFVGIMNSPLTGSFRMSALSRSAFPTLTSGTDVEVNKVFDVSNNNPLIYPAINNYSICAQYGDTNILSGYYHIDTNTNGNMPLLFRPATNVSNAQYGSYWGSSIIVPVNMYVNNDLTIS